MDEPKKFGDKLIEADDGLIANVVRDWARRKHSLVARYCGIASGPRRAYLGSGRAGAAYLDPFCAAGRCWVSDDKLFSDGSPLHAWKESVEKKAPFNQVLIGDVDKQSLDACELRLKEHGAPVSAICGKAEETIDKMLGSINPYGLHFCLLDPYSLGAMPFSIIEKLCNVKRMDILIHVSTSDLQRNFLNFQKAEKDTLDRFAPGWRDSVSADQPQRRQREQFFQHWLGLIEKAGKLASNKVEHMTTTGNNTLYYLVMVSGHPLGHKFWDVASADPVQPGLF